MSDGPADGAPTPYRSPNWLPGGHAQTIYPYFLARPQVAYRRERIAAPDGDFWDFDWLSEPPNLRADAPMAVLFHGLEGGAQSHYALMLMALLASSGWRGVIPHFRGCSGEPNLLPRAYHSGDHEDVGAMLLALRERVGPRTPMYAVGVSLGGSALLNWIGRAGSDASKMLVAAATVSVPLDLMAAGIAIGQGMNRIYTRYFLSTLKPKGLDMARRFPGLLDTRRIARAQTMRDFDDAVTAPLHGFAGVNDYWTRASSKRWLAEVALPTLVLNARNDPFVPAASLPDAKQVSTEIRLEQPDTGGHVGFMTGPAPGRIAWLPQRLLAYFVRGQ
jgi:uncharacterized protein